MDSNKTRVTFFVFCGGWPTSFCTEEKWCVLPLSVKMCRQRVTKVSAPLGQFSTKSSSSGEFIPIPRIYKKEKSKQLMRSNSVFPLVKLQVFFSDKHLILSSPLSGETVQMYWICLTSPLWSTPIVLNGWTRTKSIIRCINLLFTPPTATLFWFWSIKKDPTVFSVDAVPVWRAKRNKKLK